MKAVVFDLDGTLIDSVPDIHRAVNAALQTEDRPPLSLQRVRSFIGEGVPALIAKAMAASDLQGKAVHTRMLAAFSADYDRAPTELTRGFENIGGALDTLRRRGHALAICTNKPEAITRTILASLGLAPFFGAVIGGDTLAQRKPDPRPLMAAFERLGTSAGLYVGDSEVDAATAKAAGVPFLLFTRGYRNTPIDQIPHMASFGHFAVLPMLIARQSQLLWG